MSDKKTIQSINTDPSAPDAKTVHNFGEAMRQVAQIAAPPGKKGFEPAISFEEAVLEKYGAAYSTQPGGKVRAEATKLDGCFTEGATEAEAKANLVECIKTAVAADKAEETAQQSLPRTGPSGTVTTEDVIWAELARKNPPGTKPTSATHLFDELATLRLHQNPGKAREAIGAVIFAFKINGEGDWSIDTSNDRVLRGAHAHANVTIEVSASDFMEILHNGAKAMQLFMQGKLKVYGDPMLAMKLPKLVQLFGG